MIFTEQESIEDFIVRSLAERDKSAKELHGALETNGYEPTLQGLYKALRQLKKEQVLVKYGLKYALSHEWSEKVVSRIGKLPNIPVLSEGESISYSFTHLPHLDSYWKQLVLPLQKENPGFPVFTYNSQGIWWYVEDRKESEKAYYDFFTYNQRHMFLVLGNDNMLNREQRKLLKNKYIHFDIWEMSKFPNTLHFTIIADYIITTKLSQASSNQITHIFTEKSNFVGLDKKLSDILNKRGKFVLEIEHDPVKAKKLRKQLSKNFAIPLELKTKFQLF